MTHDFVWVLQEELARRCQQNPKYSLRSFAGALGMSPANLSLILSRKRPLSGKAFEKIARQLGWKASKEDLLVSRLGFVPKQDKDQNLSLETFEKISNWVSYAILSLLSTKGFRPDVKWIAKRLGISVHEARSTILAMEEAGVLDTKYPVWRQTTSKLRINNRHSTSVTRSFQRQLIEKALESLENDRIELRDHSSITFAISPSQLPKMKEEIRNFRLRMSEIFERPKVSTEVYSLMVQLIPMTRLNLEGEK